jgi:uncharacterized repeat protein (TIGR03803 family)
VKQARKSFLQSRNFYRTTSGGGAYGAGTVFKITPFGTLTTLHSPSAAGEAVIGGACNGWRFWGIEQQS